MKERESVNMESVLSGASMCESDTKGKGGNRNIRRRESEREEKDQALGSLDVFLLIQWALLCHHLLSCLSDGEVKEKERNLLVCDTHTTVQCLEDSISAQNTHTYGRISPVVIGTEEASAHLHE